MIRAPFSRELELWVDFLVMPCVALVVASLSYGSLELILALAEPLSQNPMLRVETLERAEVCDELVVHAPADS